MSQNTNPPLQPGVLKHNIDALQNDGDRRFQTIIGSFLGRTIPEGMFPTEL